jgi:hypothetical protein
MTEVVTATDSRRVMPTALLKTVFLVITFLASSHAVSAATYYVSNQGDDRHDGLSPAAAWATLDRVNKGPFHPGDRILFHCNNVWRGQLIPRSGNETGHVTYAAYGDGEKPLLLGSIAKSRPDDWTDEGNGIWSAGDLPIDVGNIIFGNDEACGVKQWEERDLKQDGDYWYDKAAQKVKLRAAENPAKRYAHIECAMNQHGISQGNRCHITYEDLMIKYAGAHGIGGGNTHHIIVRRCDFGFIGGGNQHGTVRFGNGVEFWGSAHDSLVEDCRLWEIYDAALTNQSSGPNTPQYNITYRNNVIWNSEYSFEYWNRPRNSETHDVYFVHNTCVNAGHGWGHAQRPDPSGRHLSFYASPAPAHNIVIRDNIFFEATKNAFYAPGWSRAQIEALVMDHNCWYQAEGQMIHIDGESYMMGQFAKYQADWNKEPHSICVVPRFVNAAKHDFRQAAGSPSLGMGVDTQ